MLNAERQEDMRERYQVMGSREKLKRRLRGETQEKQRERNLRPHKQSKTGGDQAGRKVPGEEERGMRKPMSVKETHFYINLIKNKPSQVEKNDYLPENKGFKHNHNNLK